MQSSLKSLVTRASLLAVVVALLSACGPPASRIATILADLESKSPDVQAKAVESLRALGTNAVPALLAALRGPAGDMRKGASKADFDDPASKNPLVLIAAQRRQAVLGFKAIGPTAATALPELKEMLLQKDTSIHAASALAVIQPGGLEILLAQATNPDRRVRDNVFSVIERLGPDAKASLTVFLAGIKHPQAAIRGTSAIALGGLGEDAPAEAVDALVANLGEKDADAWARTVMALGKIGARAKPAASTLLPMLRHQDTNVVNLVGHVLWKVDPEAAKKAGAVDRISIIMGNDRSGGR